MAKKPPSDSRRQARPRGQGGTPVLVSIGPVPEWSHIGISSLVPGRRHLLVPSQDTDSVSVVDLDDMEILQTIRLKQGSAPWNVRATPDGKFAYVSNSRFGGHVDTSIRENSTVSVIELASGNVVADAQVGAGPVMLEMDAKRSRAYVTNRFSDSVTLIDTSSHESIGEFKTGAAPFWIRLTPDASLLVVGNFEDATLNFVDPDSLETRQIIPVGTPRLDRPYPEFGPGDTLGFAIDSGSRIFVANWRSHSVVMVDAREALAAGRRAVMPLRHLRVRFPFSIEINEQEELLVVGSYDVKDSMLTIVDFTRRDPQALSVLASVPVDGSVLPQGRAAGINYWMSEPFESRIIGYLGRGIRRPNPIDLVAAVL